MTFLPELGMSIAAILFLIGDIFGLPFWVELLAPLAGIGVILHSLYR